MSIASRCFAFLLALIAVISDGQLVTIVEAQDPPALFGSAGVTQQDHNRGRGRVKPRRERKVRGHIAALDAPAVRFNLFDGTELVVRRTKADRPKAGRLVWHGRSDDGAIATVAVVNGVMTATVFREFETYEVVAGADGDYTVREIEPAAFPTDDPSMDEPLIEAADAPGQGGQGGAAAIAADGVIEIDVMVLWTPAARAAVGGSQNAIESLVQAAVANANLAYANSGINARLRLVYSGEVSFTESPSNIQMDLAVMTSQTDGKLDGIHTIRDQHGADLVTLLGSGYVSGGACGIGYRMATVSPAFAAYGFNVVDQSCAAGYLSYAHELGHNQGMHHDPANASGTPLFPYAYGYQDPSGAFRTVLSYGGATRIPYFSNPNVTYNGSPTGTATQYNAQVLNNTAGVVSAFRPTAGGMPPCSYSVSPTTLSSLEAGGTLSVAVTTTPNCAWSTSSSAGWLSVSGGGTGSGMATITVAPNSATARSGAVTVAGQTVSVSQAALVCTYSMSPAALSFSASASTATVAVTTAPACSWSTSSGAAWASVSGGGTGSGTATISVSANGTSARTGAVTVAGQTISLSQAAAPCTYSVSPTAFSLGSSAGSATVAVTTTSGCSWSTSSGAAWASVSGGGTGSGTATVSVSANGTSARTGAVTVAGQTVSLSQAAAPCTYSVSPTALSFNASAGTATVNVTTSSGCAWSTSSGTSWASVAGGATGSGTATVVAAANSGGARSGSVLVAGKTVTLSQAAAPVCVYSVSPTSLSLGAGGGTAIIRVTTSAGCAWSASSTTSWLTTSGGGVGNGTATVAVSTNGGAARSGSATIAGRSVSVNQSSPAKGKGNGKRQ